MFVRPAWRAALAVTAVLLSACPPPSMATDGGVTNDPPSLSALSPTSGPVAGGTAVTITGANFVNGATVKFGQTAGTQVVVLSKVQISVRTPQFGSAGKADVTVTNPDGQSATLPAAFTFEAAKVIEEAVLSNPATTTDTSGAANIKVTVLAAVQVANSTKGAGQGPGVVAKVGYAATVSSPPVDKDFTWADATYQGDVDGPTSGDLARDIYRGDVTMPGASSSNGTYFVAAKFSVDQGATWKIADRDGTANGVQKEQFAMVYVNKPSIDWCKLGGETIDPPPMLNLVVGAAGPTVYGQVYKMGVTNTGSPAASISGQLGYGPAGTEPSTWTWVAAAYNKKSGNGSNEEWQATLPNPGVGSYKFAFRFTDNGGAWSYCDADGLAVGGFTDSETGTLNVSAPGLGSCKVQYPDSLNVLEGNVTDPVFGRVFAPGVTDSPGAATGLEVELGYGPSGQMPSDAGWSWKAATYNIEVTPGGGEEYQATIAAPSAGTYSYAYRTRTTGGAWLYCDRDSSDNGYQTAQAGALNVTAPGIDSCKLQFPASLNLYEGHVSELVYGRVFAAGITNLPGAATGLQVELGYGPAGQTPSDAGWSWQAAAYNVEINPGGGEEYQATLTAPAAGSYSYAYRTRVGSGSWQYCDKDGSDNGYQTAQAGALTSSAVVIDECTLDSATATLLALPSNVVGPTYAKVRVPSLTDVTSGAVSGLTAEFGYGAVGTAPSTWSNWSAVTFDSDQAAFDQYRTSVVAPATQGTYEFTYRFKLNSGAYVYCDKDGIANGYSSGASGRLTVQSKLISACKLESVSAFAIRSGDPLSATVSVDATGTSAAGPAVGLMVQVGMGPKDDNASASTLWGWAQAPYQSEFAGGRDQFGVTVQPAYNGDRAVAGRASIDDGGTWVYCDFVGDGGFQTANQYNVTVSDHTDIAYCNTQFPSQASVDAGLQTVYGQVYVPGVTPDAGAEIRAEFGVGRESQDPGVAWSWSATRFNAPAGGNNEYAVDFTPSAAVPNYAFRYSTNDGGTWCYGDLDGNGANGVGQSWGGFSGLNHNLGEVVP